jgi:hypothetical protein
MFKKPKEKTRLDIEIELKMDELRIVSTNDKEYALILSHMEKLHKMNQELKDSGRRRVSPDTWALIGANLLGIVIIITHEFTHPITTKALTLAMRLK